MKKNRPAPLVGVVATILSVLLVAGIQTFAAPCVYEGGEAVSCVWAARAVLGAGVVLSVLSLVRIFEMDEGERRGLSLGIACVGVLVACLPGVLVELCADASMPCNAAMRPFVMGVGAALALVGAADLTVRLLRLRGRG